MTIPSLVNRVRSTSRPLKEAVSQSCVPETAALQSGKLSNESKQKTTKKKELPLNDLEIIDCGREKRARGREYHNSSSDSDSGGSCSSGQDGRSRRRCEATRRSMCRVVTSRSCKTGGSGKTSKSSKKQATSERKRSVPLLQLVEPEGPLGGGGSNGRSFVMSLTSNCHISGTRSSDVQLECGSRNGNGTLYMLPACPALWRSQQDDDSHHKEGISKRKCLDTTTSSHEKVGVSSKWMDDIIEKSVDNFKRKFSELNSDFSDGGSITQNSMCSCVQ